MNVGFWACIILVPCFAIIALLFGIFKDKSTKFISGFNTLPEKEKEMYDKVSMAKDMRNLFLFWSLIMLIGAILSQLTTPYFAIITYIIWLILFFKNVHFDAHKAFEKYLLK